MSCIIRYYYKSRETLARYGLPCLHLKEISFPQDLYILILSIKIPTESLKIKSAIEMTA